MFGVIGDASPFEPTGLEFELQVYYDLTNDCDHNGLVDIADFVTLADCLSGPGQPAAPDCACSDYDGDEDIDLADVAAFQTMFGWGNP